MIKHSLLIIVLAVVSTALMVQQDSCVPDCNGKILGEKVPDPLNCTNYYICLGDHMPTDHSVPCSATQFFNPVTSLCEAGTNCTPVCQPPDCHITCNGSFSLISNPFDCGTYYICIAGQVTQAVHCNTDNPFFNGVNCVNSKDDCCTVSCVPYCHSGIVQVPDPSNCTKYYICLQEGPVDPSLHFACDGGKYFDYQSGRCVSGTSCINLCTEGTTTTTTNSAVTTTTTSTTTTTTPTTGCVDSLTCVGSGNFPKCSYCQQEYFHCTAAGTQGVLAKCSENKVINTNPAFPYCILPTNCPYNPSL